MPDRMIRDSLLTSRNFNGYSLLAQCLAMRLIVTVDNLGRFHGKTSTVRSYCFPEMLDRVSVDEVENALQELEAGDESEAMIRRYEHEGRIYLYFVHWGDHQTLESQTSKFPDPITGKTRADQCREAASRPRPSRRKDASQPEQILADPSDPKPNLADPSDPKPNLADVPRDGDGIRDGVGRESPPTPPQGAGQDVETPPYRWQPVLDILRGIEGWGYTEAKEHIAVNTIASKYPGRPDLDALLTGSAQDLVIHCCSAKVSDPLSMFFAFVRKRSEQPPGSAGPPVLVARSRGAGLGKLLLDPPRASTGGLL